MAITAAMVKELRELSGAGMMDCKKALNETNGDMEAAMEFLRKNGQAKAEKKAGRIAAEGLCRIAVKGDTSAAVVEVNSETDFVAKNESFQEFVAAVAEQAVNTDAADIDAFMAEAWNADPAKTVKEALVEKIATIGENLNIRRFEKVTAEHGCVVSYAALAPKYVATADVPEEYKEHEKEILMAQAQNDPKNANKPANIIEKMISGRLAKELKEVCLLEQAYVKDGDLTVAKYVEQVAKENGAALSIKKFVRFETGEGLEKKVDDFAAEVAAQAGL